jgi:soluble lytic murein transglycosylase-like protein
MKGKFFLSPFLKIFKRILGLIFSFAFIHFAFASHGKDAVREQYLVHSKNTNNLVEIDQRLLAALIRVESSNNPKAYCRSTGARGLTQITPAAWRDLVANYPKKYRKLKYRRDIYRPDVAREAGKDYLNLLKRYLKTKRIPVTLDNLLAAYNWGINNLGRFGLHRAPRQTRRYIAKIKSILEA